MFGCVMGDLPGSFLDDVDDHVGSFWSVMLFLPHSILFLLPYFSLFVLLLPIPHPPLHHLPLS